MIPGTNRSAHSVLPTHVDAVAPVAGVTSSPTTGASVITVVGDVDTTNGPELHARVLEVAAHRSGDVIVDLSGVRGFTAGGIDLLRQLSREIGSSTRILRVVVGDGPARTALQDAPVQETWPSYPTLAAAVNDADEVPSPAGRLADVDAALEELDELSPADGLQTALTRLCRLTCVVVDTADAASVVLGAPTAPILVADSSSLAQSLDGAQLLAGQGPSVDAYRSSESVVTRDIQADARWPDMAHRFGAGAGGTASCVAVPIRRRQADGPELLGVLTVYGPAGHDVAPAALREVRRFAGRAVALVMTAGRMQELATVRDQLRQALMSSAVIDQAKGIVMRDQRCTADQAFEVLKRMSNQQNRKVRDLAELIVRQASTN